MTLYYLQPLLRLRAAIAITSLLTLSACAGLTQTRSDVAPVSIEPTIAPPVEKTLDVAVVELPAMEPLEPLVPLVPIVPIVPLIVPSIAAKSALAGTSTNPPTDAIAFWLGEAGWAFEQDKLTTPKGDNSYYYLTRVLAKDADNPKAIVALEKIVERYYELLQSSLAQNKVEQARVFLSRAMIVMPRHSQLAAMRKLINRHAVKQSAKVSEPATAVPAMRNQQLLLPIKLLNKQDQLLAQWLVLVAQKAHDLNATMLIVAPKDDQARWLYKTMNSADPEQRIRANIKHSSPARIEVKYLARKDELEVYPN